MSDLWITLIMHPCFLASLLLAWCLCYFSVPCVCCVACLQQFPWIIDKFWASTFHFTTWTHTPSGQSHWSRWPWSTQGQPSCWKGSCLGVESQMICWPGVDKTAGDEPHPSPVCSGLSLVLPRPFFPFLGICCCDRKQAYIWIAVGFCCLEIRERFFLGGIHSLFLISQKWVNRGH